MLNEYGDRTFILFAAAFEPKPGHVAGMAQAAQLLSDAVGATNWGSGPNTFVCRNPPDRFVGSVRVGLVSGQAMTLPHWQARATAFAKAVVESLHVLQVRTLKRLSFRTVTFVPLEMSHEELVSLFCGTFTQRPEQLGPPLGRISDAEVSFLGTTAGLTYKLDLNPQTGAQAREVVQSNRQLFDSFLGSRYLDDGVQKFVERVSQTTLNVGASITQEGVPIERVPAFVQEAQVAADALGDAAVSRVKGIPPFIAKV